MQAGALGAGSTIAQRFRLVEPLGEGGMGTVWRADHLVLGSAVAVKLLRPGSLDGGTGDAKARRRFSVEAQAAAKLRSPHVVQVLDHGFEDGVPYIVMELLEGESLARRIRRNKALDLAQTERVVTQIARALARAHAEGIIHRDLKPDNVFIVPNDDDEVVKVLDFGIAKVVPLTEAVGSGEAPSQTDAGTAVGTPSYMSPEQIRGEPVDSRADVWSLAVVAFECLTGRLPFTGRTVGDLLFTICSAPPPAVSRLVEVPPAIDAWFERALERRPGDRFPTAREAADAFRAAAGLPALRGGGSEVTPPPPLAEDDPALIAPTAATPRAEPSRRGESTGSTATLDVPLRTRGRPALLAIAALAVALVVAWMARRGAAAPEARGVVAPSASGPVVAPAPAAERVASATTSAGNGPSPVQVTPVAPVASAVAATPSPSASARPPPRAPPRAASAAPPPPDPLSF